LWQNTSESGDEQFSFKVYIDNMRMGQHDTYYIMGENIADVPLMPPLKTLRRQGSALGEQVLEMIKKQKT